MKRGAARILAIPVLAGLSLGVPLASAHAEEAESLPARGFVIRGADDLSDLSKMRAARELACSGGGLALLTSPDDVVDPMTYWRVTSHVDLRDLEDGSFVVIVASGVPGSPNETGGVAAGVVGGRQGECMTLTSDGTRRDGVVSLADVERLMADGHFGWVRPVPGGNLGLLLEDRYLEQRRMYVPVGLAAGTATLLVLALALFIYFRRERVGERTRIAGEWACFAVPSMAVGMLACGHLTNPNYVSVGLVIATCALVLPGIALAFRKRGPLAAPFAFGLLLLVFFAVEAAMGWPATLFTLLGGTALDGARFYGLPNAFMGLLLGGALFMAPSLRSVGAPLIVAVGLLAGLPQLGANMGAAITIMFAAGLWIALTTPSWRGIAAGIAVGAAGLAVVVAAHVWSDAPTHVTALAESGGLDPGSLIDRAIDRLGIGIDLLRRSPVGITYLIATPIVLWFVIKPRGGWRDAFEAFPAWRSAMLTILAASIVAYFVNDTGVSAVGQGFAMALGGLLYVPLARASGRIGAR